MKKIGLFAGAFDPIHDGHLEVAREAVNQLGLDSLFFMVEQKPWGSKVPVDHGSRKAMVDLSVSGEERLSRLDTGDERFSIDNTLAELEAKFSDSELYFVFGADVFMNMNTAQWPGLERLFKHYIVVFERSTLTEKEISNHAMELGIAVAIIPSMHPNHSSTDVRLKPRDKSLWVPKQVADYIEQKELY